MTSLSELDPKGERIPGDFKRDAKGTPYVSDPTGATVKGGDRVKWVRYGRPSGFGKQIENTYNLAKWNERQIVLGICVAGIDGDDVHALMNGDVESTEWKSIADGVVVGAKAAAKAGIAAERGTHGHSLTEDHDNEKDWVKRVEAGEELGIPAHTQAAMVEAWRTMLDRYGIEILAVEVAVVHDEYRQAGTLDRIVQLSRDIRFIVDGEIVTLPAGTVLVLDLKTGKLRLDGGRIQYWHSYVVQVATYAGAIPYDTATETRGEWGYEISQQWAVIAHLPVDEALDGRAVCRLVLVDLEKGNAAARLCLAAARWEQSKDALGMAHPEEPEIVVEVPPASTTAAGSWRAPGGTVWTATMPDESELMAEPKDAPKVRIAYGKLTERQRTVFDSIVREAVEAKVPFNQIKRIPTVRRFECIRLVLRIAKNMELDPVNPPRAVLRLVMGDMPEVEHAPLGALIGSLTVDDLRQACRLVEDYADGKFEEDWSSFPMRLNPAG